MTYLKNMVYFLFINIDHLMCSIPIFNVLTNSPQHQPIPKFTYD